MDRRTSLVGSANSMAWLEKGTSWMSIYAVTFAYFHPLTFNDRLELAD